MILETRKNAKRQQFHLDFNRKERGWRQVLLFGASRPGQRIQYLWPADAPKARGEDSDSEMSRLCQQGDLRHAGSTTVGSRLHGYVAREGEVDSNTVNFIRDPTLPESCSKIVQDLDLEENA